MLLQQQLDHELSHSLLPLIEQSSAYDVMDLARAQACGAQASLAIEQGQLIGCIIYRRGKRLDFDKENQTNLPDNTEVVYVDLLQVDNDYRFQGIGKKLWMTLRNNQADKPIILVSTVFSTDFWCSLSERKEHNWFRSLPN